MREVAGSNPAQPKGRIPSWRDASLRCSVLGSESDPETPGLRERSYQLSGAAAPFYLPTLSSMFDSKSARKSWDLTLQWSVRTFWVLRTMKRYAKVVIQISDDVWFWANFMNNAPNHLIQNENLFSDPDWKWEMISDSSYDQPKNF